jgi:predicted DNA-binding transcriptional regulator AlpA
MEQIMEYEFTLKFKVEPEKTSEDDIHVRLGEAGCTDALVGLGLPGYVGLEFIREAGSAEEAILSALADVKKALPGATFVEAGPDFVGLTDVADLLGMSRQNMRKLFISHAASFPPPVHGGASMVWHLAQVLEFLKTRAYEFTPSVLEVATASMQVNIAKERTLLDARLDERLRRQLAA